MSTRQSPDLSGILPAASGDSVRQIDCKTEEEFIMSMIRVENITFSYPSSFDPVFENVRMETRTCRKKRKRKNNFAETSSWRV